MVDEVNATSQEEEKVPIGEKNDIYVDEFDKNAVAKALGFDKFSSIKKYNHQIERLIEWAKMKGAKDHIDIVDSIKKLANRVGSPPLGTNIAQHLSTYAYLEMERLKIDKQLREMEADINATKKKTSST